MIHQDTGTLKRSRWNPRASLACGRSGRVDRVSVTEVLIQRLDPDLPVRRTRTPAMPARTCWRSSISPSNRANAALVGTGVAIALPDGYAAFVHPRSGLAAGHGLTIVNAPGTVDAGYRGEIRSCLINTDPHAECQAAPRRPDRAAGHPAGGARAVRRGRHAAGSARGDGGYGSTGGFGGGARGTGGPLISTEARIRRLYVTWPAVPISGCTDREAEGKSSDLPPQGQERGSRDRPGARRRRDGGRRGPRVRSTPPRSTPTSWRRRTGSTSARCVITGHARGWSCGCRSTSSPARCRRSCWCWRTPLSSCARSPRRSGPASGPRYGVRSPPRPSRMGGPRPRPTARSAPSSCCVVPVEDRKARSSARPHAVIGVDGPRWLLRATVLGRAAVEPDAATPMEETLRSTIVVRGTEPMAVRESLPLRLPPGAQPAAEAEA